MDPSQVATSSVFENVKFVVEIVLFGGIGGTIGFLWTAMNDWRNQAREDRKLFLGILGRILGDRPRFSSDGYDDRV